MPKQAHNQFFFLPLLICVTDLNILRTKLALWVARQHKRDNIHHSVIKPVLQ